MKFGQNLSAMVASAAFLFLAAGAAVAKPAPVVQPVCSTASVTTSTACRTVADNNDGVAGMNGFNSGAGVFNVNNWIYGGKSAGDNDPVSPFNLSASLAGAQSGTWSVASFGGWTKAALVVKGGSSAWVAYLLDVTKLNGTWTTNDIRNNGGNQPNISHLTLYLGGQKLTAPPTAPVPVPGAGLLLAGLAAGLAALGLRKARA